MSVAREKVQAPVPRLARGRRNNYSDAGMDLLAELLGWDGPWIGRSREYTLAEI